MTCLLPRLTFLLLAVCGTLPIAVAQQFPDGASLKIAIIGDSTVSDYPPQALKRGWGQELPQFLDLKVAVINAAIPGTSSKTFPPLAWKGILAAKPDFILIQFGHNDSHPKGQPESTDAATDYKENLRRYVTEARAASAIPLLVTPPHRRTFDASGHPTQELASYAQAMREVATELGVPLIDLQAESGALFASLGEAGTTAFTVNLTDTADRPGQEDRSHFTEPGAMEIARLVATDLQKIDPRLQAVVRLPSEP